MDKLKMMSMDKVSENIEKIKALFPNCVTEVKRGEEVEYAIDFDVLKQELSKELVDEREERYQMTWPDKKKSVVLANSPINKTLRPCREESVDFDNTENLYIEGDNLEVLKLLQETYLGKIKMIYIDPPYNTGNDSFVYNDVYSMSEEEFLSAGGYYDEDGNRVIDVKENNESNGRFHTDWLNMIYPRLRLARDLLSDDGVIFISIDDNEQANLKKVCDEIFGEANFIAAIKVLSNPRGRQSMSFFANSGEYLLIYSKNFSWLVINGENPSEDQIATYNKTDEIGRFRDMGLRKRGSDSKKEDAPTLFFPIYYNPETKDIDLQCHEGYITIIPKLEDGSDGRWRWSSAKIKKDKNLLYCRQVNRNGELVYDVFQKDYLSDDNKIKIKDFWIEKEINYDRSSEEIRDIFKDKLFDFAKPLYIIRKIINTVINKNDNSTILDFFSGSATTAHAVMQLNSEDGGNRKFIMVQLPEACDEKSEAYKAGYRYKNICEIGKERIRRAGKKIKEESPLTTQNLDTGFRVLKLDSSNMLDVYYNPDKIEQTSIFDYKDNIKADRSAEDLLFQIMLDMGVTLSAKIEEKEINGTKVFAVDGDFLVACFADNLTDDTLTEIAKLKPRYAAFRDSSFANDSVAKNCEQIFATYSPNTKCTVV